MTTESIESIDQSIDNNQSLDPISFINSCIDNTLYGLDAIVSSLVARDKDDKFLKPEDRINNALYITHCLYKELISNKFHQEN